MGIIPSSSCSAVPYGIGWTQRRRRRRGPSSTRSSCDRPRFNQPTALGPTRESSFQTLYQFLVEDDTRNRVICEEMAQAVSAGRSPLVLTERNEHLDRFESALSASVPHVVVLRGGMGKKQRRAAAERLAATRPSATPSSCLRARFRAGRPTCRFQQTRFGSVTMLQACAAWFGTA